MTNELIKRPIKRNLVGLCFEDNWRREPLSKDQEYATVGGIGSGYCHLYPNHQPVPSATNFCLQGLKLKSSKQACGRCEWGQSSRQRCPPLLTWRTRPPPGKELAFLYIQQPPTNTLQDLATAWRHARPSAPCVPPPNAPPHHLV